VSAPPWLVTRAISVLLGAAGAYPALKAVRAGQLHESTFALQVVASGVVLGGYLLLTASSGRGAGGSRT
jgi:hypothetical protein